MCSFTGVEWMFVMSRILHREKEGERERERNTSCENLCTLHWEKIYSASFPALVIVKMLLYFLNCVREFLL